MFCIGKGSNGKIFTESTNSEYVMKKIKCCLCNKIYREIFFSRHLQNPNVIQSNKIEYLNDCVMITYPKKCMDLQKFLYQFYLKHKVIPQKVLENFIFQILISVSYMHHEGIAHRDLKLDNFLIGEYNENFFSLENQVLDLKCPKLYLTDFGCAKIIVNNIKDSDFCFFSGPICSLILQSPEMLQYDYKNSYDPYKVDIWCIGCMIFALCKGFYPFQGNNINEVLQSISSFDLKKHFLDDDESIQLKIIKNCFLENPNKRASIKNLLEFLENNTDNIEHKKIFENNTGIEFLFGKKINLDYIKGKLKAFVKKCLHILLQSLQSKKYYINEEKIFLLCCLFIQKSKQIEREDFAGNALVACISLSLDLCSEKSFEVEPIINASNFYFSNLDKHKILKLKRKIILI